MPTRPKVIAFDIIETVFSLEVMRDRLVALGLPASALEAWFAAGLRDAFALAVTDRFAPFRSVLETALAEVMVKQGLSPDREKIAATLDSMTSLRPQPDAALAFDLLKKAGFRIVAMSNGAAAATEALLEGGGLRGLVERVLSVEDVGLSKPRREVYRHTAEAADVAPSDLALVAAHAWDTHGAKAAGLTTAFVARGRLYPSVMLPPDIVGNELVDVARDLANLR